MTPDKICKILLGAALTIWILRNGGADAGPRFATISRGKKGCYPLLVWIIWPNTVYGPIGRRPSTARPLLHDPFQRPEDDM